MSKGEAQVESFLRGLRRALNADNVLITRKAAEEAASELHMRREEVFEILAELTGLDFDHATASVAVPGDEIWVFTPVCDEVALWIRLVERGKVIVVSFHEA